VTRVVLATRNDHKVVELRAILADVCDELGVEIVGASEWPDAPEVVEDEVSFEGNARLKAVALAKHTGLPSLADDSGLAVEVLGGAPGIFSARWSGRHGDDRANLQLLLDQLADVKDEHRDAAFVCAAVLAMPSGEVRATEGRMPGRLAREAKGTNGFGYDPILVVEGDTRHSAELSPQEKNAISHRGKAFRAMAPHLRELLA
jgi:XTP/dITP diphosphohydrolase